jgi:alkyldihydroxyacetonephosphate synthase
VGAPNGFKHPSEAWYRMMQEEFGLNDDDFKERKFEGLERVAEPPPLHWQNARALD